MKLEKRILQLAVALGAVVPVLAGAAGVLAGVGMIPQAVSEPALDSHYRYLSGLLLAIGLGFWSAVPNIERKTERVRLLTAIVVIGGLARAYGWLIGDRPGTMAFALVMELAVTPLLCLWQGRVARRTLRSGEPPFKSPVAAAGRADALRPDPSPGK